MSHLSRPSTVASRSVRFASGILALRRGDFILAAFPRSGSTWTRHVLCNLIALNEWDGRDIGHNLDETMPALGASNLFAPWTHPTLPRVVKTHKRYSPLLGRIPSIGLIRDPRDVMVSRYRLLRDKLGEYEGSFGDFIRHRRHGLPAWFAHYVSWRNRWILVMRYEDMLQDPAHEFVRLLAVLGVSCPDGMLEEAIARSSFESLQRAEKRRRPSAEGESLFFRSGSSGQWRDYFGDDDLRYYLDLSAKHGASIDARI